MHPIAPETRRNITSLLEQEFSIRQIAKKCGVSKSTVQNICKMLTPTIKKPSAGHPPKLSLQDKHACVHAITSGGLETATAVAKKLQEDLSIQVNRCTVGHALQEAGLSAMEKEK